MTDTVTQALRLDGYNGAISQAIRALRYLAENSRPIEGERFPNSACCYQVANELERTLVEFEPAITAWNTRDGGAATPMREAASSVTPSDLIERIEAGRVDDVLAEVTRATDKFPTWPTDPIHAMAVLGEEYGELNKAVLQAVYEPHKSSPADVREEAIQCAAMAVRFLMSLPIYRYEGCEQHYQAQHCDHCGAGRDARSPFCAPPFDVQPHEWTGKHPADKRAAALKAREAVQ